MFTFDYAFILMQIARAAVVFNVDEIVVFDDGSKNPRYDHSFVSGCNFSVRLGSCSLVNTRTVAHSYLTSAVM